MKLSRHTARMLSAGLLAFCVAAAAPSVRADVLEQLPGDTLAVLKVNHLDATSKKIADLMQTLGVTDFQPALGDPLAAMMNQTGLTAGINKSGDFAIGWLNKPWKADQKDDAGNDIPPPLVALVPVSDYKAFIDQNTVVSTDGDLTVVKFKQDKDAKDNYVAHWGDYAAISPEKDCLTAKPTGLKVAGLSARELTDKDFCLYGNFSVLKTKLLPLIEKGRAEAQEKASKALTDKGPDAASKEPLVKAAVDEVMNGAKTFVENCDGATLGYSIDKAGVNSTVIAEFNPDSYLGKLSQMVKGTDGPMLAGLPDQKYLFLAGFVSDAGAAKQLYNDIVTPLEAHFDVMGDQAPALHALVESYRQAVGAAERNAFGMVAPSAAVGQGSLVQFLALSKGDAQKLHDAQEEQTKAQPALMKSLNLPNAEATKTVYTENVKTVDGVKFDSIQTTFNFPGNTPQEMQAQQAVNLMYGPNGLTMYSGVVDSKTLLLVAGGDDALLSAALGSAKDNKDIIGKMDPIQAVDAELPKTRVGVMYLPLDQVVSTAVGYAKQFGFPMPVQLPPNLPPIGATAGTEGAAIRFDSHVPTQLVQSLIQAGMQVFLQMRGGNGGGNNGGNGL